MKGRRKEARRKRWEFKCCKIKENFENKRYDDPPFYPCSSSLLACTRNFNPPPSGSFPEFPLFPPVSQNSDVVKFPLLPFPLISLGNGYALEFPQLVRRPLENLLITLPNLPPRFFENRIARYVVR